MSMEKFVMSKCQGALYHLRSIAQIRHFLDEDATRTLIQALVISRLDYANSLLIGVSKLYIRPLQLIQNSAARLITRSPFRDHITPILYRLHWLPVEYHVCFKVLLFYFNCLRGSAPNYLIELLNIYEPIRPLRSSSQLLLNVPKSFSKLGDRSFEVYAPKEWNQLPLSIRSITSLCSFKRNLKTYFFKQYFNDFC